MLTAHEYNGTVESIGAATGARFSLLPPENATGNYVKVVQRIPVRIRFDKGQDPDINYVQACRLSRRCSRNK